MRKHMKKLLALLIICNMAVLVMTGCGKKEDVNTSKQQPDTNNEVKEETPRDTVAVRKVELKEDTFIYSEDFEGDRHYMTERGDVFLEVTDEVAYSGERSLMVSGRTQNWMGASYNVTNLAGSTLKLEAWLMSDDEGAANRLTFIATLLVNRDGKEEYIRIGTLSGRKGDWVKFEGEILVPENISSAAIYFEKADNSDYYLDDFYVEAKVAAAHEFPSIAKKHKDNWLFGVGIDNSILEDEKYDYTLNYQFNNFTLMDEMTPEALLDEATNKDNASTYYDNPALDFNNIKYALEYAKVNGLKMRGNTLIWHSKTPNWFFTEDYTDNGNLVSKEVMLKRMESYIKQVIQFCDTNYPGVVYAWDVVKDAIFPEHGQSSGYRTDSKWYQTIGEEYVYYAFQYARKYAKDDVKLFYSDYDFADKILYTTFLLMELKNQNYLDGISMQSGFGLTNTAVSKVVSTISKLGELGLEIHITELNVSIGSNNPTDEIFKRQEAYYRDLFTNLKQLDDSGEANITNVTVWGISDNETDKSQLFDENLTPKRGFYGVMLQK